MDDPSFSSSSAGSSQIDPNRRPIKMRSTRWARALAAAFAKFGVSPNQVSLFSVACALIGAGLFLTEAFGPGSKLGELYNEIPDRIADVFFLASAGYASAHAAWGIALGWSASVLAVGTAYIRALGARRGAAQDFCGPAAKQQRMFLLTVGSLGAAGEHIVGWPRQSLFWMLVIINFGALVTCIRRTLHLAERLETAS